MAAVAINISFIDDAGKRATTSHYLPAGTTVADAQDHAEYLCDLIDDMTGCAIYNVTITYDVPFDSDASLKILPSANSDVEEGARFVWRTAGGYSASNRIPGFLESLIVDNTADVDQNDVIVQEYVGYMLAGNDADPDLEGDPTDYRGDDIVALVTAREAFTKSRKRR